MDFFDLRKCERRKPLPGLQTGRPHAAVLLTPLWLQMMCVLFPQGEREVKGTSGQEEALARIVCLFNTNALISEL